MTTVEKRNLIWFICYIYQRLFYYLIVLDVLSVLHALDLHCQGFLMLSDFNWKVLSWNHIEFNSGENESIFLIFVYNSGTKYGKQTCGVARKHN